MQVKCLESLCPSHKAPPQEDLEDLSGSKLIAKCRAQVRVGRVWRTLPIQGVKVRLGDCRRVRKYTETTEN